VRRAVLMNGVGHLEGLDENCRDRWEEGCEEESTGLLQ
jgi:hypothetical protein